MSETTPTAIKRHWNLAIRDAATDHPALYGMLCHLPPQGTSWNTVEREAWLETFLVLLNFETKVDALAAGEETDDEGRRRAAADRVTEISVEAGLDD